MPVLFFGLRPRFGFRLKQARESHSSVRAVATIAPRVSIAKASALSRASSGTNFKPRTWSI